MRQVRCQWFYDKHGQCKTVCLSGVLWLVLLLLPQITLPLSLVISVDVWLRIGSGRRALGNRMWSSWVHDQSGPILSSGCIRRRLDLRNSKMGLKKGTLMSLNSKRICWRLKTSVDSGPVLLIPYCRWMLVIPTWGSIIGRCMGCY